MRILVALLAVHVLLATGSTITQARISYADSDLFAIDTVTSVDDPVPGLGGTTRLLSVHPNPFNPETKISFYLADEGRVDLTVYDVHGRLVTVVESGKLAAGRHEVAWDGTGRGGRAVSSGIYYCRLVAGDHRRTLNLMLIR